MYTAKEKTWSFAASALFVICGYCLVVVPLYSSIGVTTVDIFLAYGFELLWMAVCLFTPNRQLTRRLTLLVLGMLTLVALNEISKLNLHQYLQAPKASMIEELVKSLT
jgi:uncharacterized membrane protein